MGMFPLIITKTTLCRIWVWTRVQFYNLLYLCKIHKTLPVMGMFPLIKTKTTLLVIGVDLSTVLQPSVLV